MANKVIRATAIIEAKDQTGDAFKAIGRKVDQLAKNAKASKAFDELARSLENAKKQAQAIDKFRFAQSGFIGARTNFRAAQAEVERLARSMKGVSAPTARMVSEMRRAQAAVRSTSAEFERQKSAVMAAKKALSDFGIPANKIVSEERRLKSAIEATNAALVRRAQLDARSANRREALGLLASGAGVAAAYHGRQIGAKAIVSAAEFDIGVRKQRAFSDLSEADQAALLIPQARRIGQETQFTNLDVIKAQTKAMQGLPAGFSARLKAEVAQGILENVKNYALVMEADLETSAEAIRSYLQATGKDISTKEKALAEANKATNQLVKMAKLGGMSDEDVQQFMKYAAASGTTAGLTPETLMSLAALARRGGLRGDEAGVFMRSTASKLVSPTKQGRAALLAAGIDYNRYVSMPQRLETSRLESQFRNDIGVGFNPAVRARLDKILSDPKVLGDRGLFTQAVTDAVSPLFPRTRRGKMAAADRQKIAKAAGTFYGNSAETVDTERLLNDIMSSNMTLAQLNAFLTDKHGGKGAITQAQWDEFRAARAQLGTAANDPDFAKRKADEIMGGLGGSFENLKGSVDNLITSLGQANEGLLKFSFDGIGRLLDSFSRLDQTTQQVLSIAGGGAALGAGGYGAFKIAQGLMGMGPAGALTGSAAALTEAAAALNVAAVRLGGGSAAGAAATAAGAAGGSRLPRFLGYGGLAFPLVAGGYLAYEGVKALHDQNAGFEGLTGRERLRARGGGTMQEVIGRHFDEQDQQQRVTLDPNSKAQVDVRVRVEGEGRVVGMSAESSGNIRANVGTSMPHIKAGPR